MCEWCKIKGYVIWRCNNAKIRSSWATPTFIILLWCLLEHGSHTLLLYAHACAKSDHLQACIEPCLLIDWCCRPRECYPCSMSGLLLCKACVLGLCKATPTFSKHVLVLVNMLEPLTALYTTPTNLLLYLLVIRDICIATYLQYANRIIWTCTLVLAIQVWPRLLSESPVSSCDPISILTGVAIWTTYSHLIE